MNPDFEKEISQMKKVVLLEREANRLNRPTVEENSKIKDYNAEINAKNKARLEKNPNLKEKYLLKKKTMLRMPHSMPKWAKQALKSQSKKRAALNRLQPEIWRSRINSIKPERLRNRIACVIWWDWFGSRPPSKGFWPHLNKLINQPYKPCDDADIMEALVEIGYTPWHAFNRLNMESEDTPADENKGAIGEEDAQDCPARN